MCQPTGAIALANSRDTAFEEITPLTRRYLPRAWSICWPRGAAPRTAPAASRRKFGGALRRRNAAGSDDAAGIKGIPSPLWIGGEARVTAAANCGRQHSNSALQTQARPPSPQLRAYSAAQRGSELRHRMAAHVDALLWRR
jgi:hypothetical protein